MEKPADWLGFAEHVEALHRVLSLQDLDLDVVLGQKLQGLRPAVCSDRCCVGDGEGLTSRGER
jgi:hypothetical protein